MSPIWKSTQICKGPKAAAIPGEILGYYEAKTRFGNPDVTWESLLQPTIDMCRDGVEVGYALADALNFASDIIKNDDAAS